MASETKLEIGMLLLVDPEKAPDDSYAKVWAVAKVWKTKTKLVAHYGTCYAEADLNGTTLPKGWTVVDNNRLARSLLITPDHLADKTQLEGDDDGNNEDQDDAGAGGSEEAGEPAQGDGGSEGAG